MQLVYAKGASISLFREGFDPVFFVNSNQYLACIYNLYHIDKLFRKADDASRW